MKRRKRSKWPKRLMLIRHGESAFNRLKKDKAKNALYQEFEAAYKQNPASEKTQRLARKVWKALPLDVSDAQTPLTAEGRRQAKETGAALRKKKTKVPHVILVSPYCRTKATLRQLMVGWPELAKVKVYEEERLREWEIGLRGRYHDWRIFNALHPEQRELREQEGAYWYRLPQGENLPDLRERLRSLIGTLIREFRGKRVLIVAHHMTILALRANLERLDQEEFERIDHEEKPINCGVTLYKGKKRKGTRGKLCLKYYNRKYYD